MIQSWSLPRTSPQQRFIRQVLQVVRIAALPGGKKRKKRGATRDSIVKLAQEGTTMEK